MYIYKTTNNINGKIYIGLSSKEYDKHKWYLGSGVRIKLAVKKYGRSNFKKELLEECASLEELKSREKYWIQHWRDSIGLEFMYNISDGGDLVPSEICKKRGYSGQGNPNYGNYWTDAQKKAQSEKIKGRSYLLGENNPSKNSKVRKKISDGKKGGNNPNATPWLIIHPDGTAERIEGGIKNRLIELGVTYIRFPKTDEDGFRYGTTHEFKIKKLTKQ